MNNSFIKPLLSPRKLKQELPVGATQLHFIENARNQIRRILNGIDSRLLLIVGPCSIHDTIAAKHYATLLRELIEEVQEEFFIVMRTHVEKPRTSLGWKGLIYDPYLDGSHDVETGLRWTRELLLELNQMGIPIATEILDPALYPYLEDLVAWGCIGARTASCQIHRQIASGLNFPVAFKNNTDGNVEVAINGVLTASECHTYIRMNEEGMVSTFRSQGNPDCHIVLRGSQYKPNYDTDSIHYALAMLEKAKLPLKILIDCSHDNSRRDHKKQIEVFDNVIGQIISGNRSIRGLVLESHILEGRQNLGSNSSHLRYGVSITDPCLDWNSTAEMIRKARFNLIAGIHNMELNK